MDKYISQIKIGFKEAKVLCISSFLVVIILSILIAFFWPPTYESKATIKINVDSSSNFAALALGMGSSSASINNYIEIMKSRSVVAPIISNLDIDSEEKKYMKPEDFVKKNIQIENIKQTDLVTITSKGRTPEEAQVITQSLISNLENLLTDRNRQTQSVLIKFLSERINNAKEEAEEAQKKFADFQVANNVYQPNEQVKDMLDKMSTYDEAISKAMVDINRNQAKKDTVLSSLQEMSDASITYNINDNSLVQSIRNQIVKKNLELISLKNDYTEEHPSVIKAENELKELNESLKKEVSDVVLSKYTTLNPAQASLIVDEANSEVAIEVAKLTKSTLENQKQENEKSLKDFPPKNVEYIKLSNDAKIKGDVYNKLVVQNEDARIKQAMESMNVEIIDEPNLSLADVPVWPRKKLVVFLGFISGLSLMLIISFLKAKAIHK